VDGAWPPVGAIRSAGGGSPDHRLDPRRDAQGRRAPGPPALGSSGPLRIAPAEAGGTILYLGGTRTSPVLKGLTIGGGQAETVLTPEEVEMKTVSLDERRKVAVECVGCHAPTPDGRHVGFTAQSPWGNAIAAVGAGAGQAPGFLGAGARAALQQKDLGIQAFSAAHWSELERIVIAPIGASSASELAWFDLRAARPGPGSAYGVIRRAGDPRGAGAPAWSCDGSTIAYVSTDAQYTGRLASGEADLYTVPYARGAGGRAQPVPGASEPGIAEFYPAFSPDDRYLVFARSLDGNMYNQPLAELFVVPAGGGTPTRLLANDPPACSGEASPGVTNSWARWSPGRTAVGERVFYWIVFSSTRDGRASPQLYLAGIVVEGGQTSTYAALHLGNQLLDEPNHMPTWSATPPAP
jgi:hypothetical protein